MNPFEEEDNPFDIKPNSSNSSLNNSSNSINNYNSGLNNSSNNIVSNFNKSLNQLDGANSTKESNNVLIDPLSNIEVNLFNNNSSNNNNKRLSVAKPLPSPPTQKKNPLPSPSSPINHKNDDDLNPFLTNTTTTTTVSAVKVSDPLVNNNNNQDELTNPFFKKEVKVSNSSGNNKTQDELNPFLLSDNNSKVINNDNNKIVCEDEINPFITGNNSSNISCNHINNVNNNGISINNNSSNGINNNEDELNPFLNDSSTNKKPLPPVPPQQQQPSTTIAPTIVPNFDVDSLIKNIKNQMNRDFENKELVYKNNLKQLNEQNESLKLSLEEVNKKYMKILEKNEELENTNKFINQHKSLLNSSNNSNNSNNISSSNNSSNINNNNNSNNNFNISQEIKRLNNYKTFKEKKELLLKSYQSLDMDSTLVILHYIYNSLNVSLFINMVQSISSDLFDMFLGYLRRIGKFNDVIALQKQVNQRSEEIYINLFLALQDKQDMNKRSVLLTQWYDSFSSMVTNNNSSITVYPGFEVFLKQVEVFVSVLNRQFKIEEFDRSLEAKGDVVFSRVKRFNVVGKSLYDTIYYCLLYHPNAPKDKLSSPISYKELYDVSNKIYLFNQLVSRSLIQDWNYISNILPKKKGIFNRTYQSDIPIDAFVEILTLYNAPFELIETCARMIESDERRYECSMQYRVYTVALESLINLKQLKKVNQLRIKLMESNQQFLIQKLDESLSNPKLKWK